MAAPTAARTRLLAALICSTPLALAQSELFAPQNPAPVPFSSPDGRFQAEFPTPPKHSVVPVHVRSIRDVTLHEYASTPDNQHAFVVVYTDYKKAISLQRVCETFSAGRRHLGHTFVRLNGVAGCQVAFEDENHSFMANAYVVGRRVYQILAILPLNSDPSADVARFFMSFNFSRPK